ncbi:MAG: hypothetical protein FJX47_13425, partial [Alphaproteobacteria bacterium]|nr:hypothetical protein [Alphaproteobacteria bacterium]
MTDLLDLSRPEVQSALLPLALAFALAGAIRLLGGPGRGQAVAAIAVGLAFLAAYAVIVGLPPVPPRSGSQKVFHIVAIALALGAFLDLAPSLRNVAPAILVAGPIVAFLWLAWARLDGFAFNLESGSAVLRVVLGIAVLWRLASLLKDQATGAVLTLVYALGAGAIALIGHSASIAQLAFALAAATGGFLL